MKVFGVWRDYEKKGKLYPKVMERKEHRGQKGRQSQHHRAGKGRRKERKELGPYTEAKRKREKCEHRTEAGEHQEKQDRVRDQGGSQDKRNRDTWLPDPGRDGIQTPSIAFVLDQVLNYSACSS